MEVLYLVGRYLRPWICRSWISVGLPALLGQASRPPVAALSALSLLARYITSRMNTFTSPNPTVIETMHTLGALLSTFGYDPSYIPLLDVTSEP